MTIDTKDVFAPSDRKTLLEGPLGAILMLPASSTGGRLSLVEHPLQPRALGSPMHTHRNEDEYSVVLEGVVGAQIGDRVLEAGVGSVVVKPRGVPHAFWNPSDEPCRLLEIISPAGFENYFEELAGILAQLPPDLAALRDLADRYGLDLDPTSIPRLVEEHGLTVHPLQRPAQ
jgi:mannose-6-phosphate isomerase-like protein (cupin superfamily)